jgi:hypothetical protein
VQRAVEEATGTILNRNHKTAVLALALWGLPGVAAPMVKSITSCATG